MEKDWVLAYQTGHDYKAAMLKEIFADHNIESVIINKKDSSYKFGDIEVYVNRKNILKAKMLVEKFES